MRRVMMCVLLVLGIVVQTSAFASGAYDFCVTQLKASQTRVVHSRFKYGDIDPGKEAARVIVSQRYRDAATQSVQVTDFDAKTCAGPTTEEMTVSATTDQLQHLANAVGRGDVPGATVIAVDIAAGATVAVVKGVGNAGGSIVKSLCNMVGLHC
jgi:hypothetical protein